jgi:hypothetical protein
MEEAMELIHRLQTAHSGRLAESEAREKLGPWVTDAAKRAEQLSWLAIKGSPAVLMVTHGGRKALDAALATKNAVPPPHWLGGALVSVRSPTGPVLPPGPYKPYMELQKRALEEGILTQEDIDRIARSPRREDQPGEPEEYRSLYESTFPGRRWFMAGPTYSEDHPLGGGMLDPAGYEGVYQVTATLTRRGSPNIPYVYVTDPNMMEGDSHLWLPELTGEGGSVGVLSIVHTSYEDGDTMFELVPNRQGRLGKIHTLLRAESIGDAHKKAYSLLNPVLCDLSYRYDIPIEVLQMNVAELATLALGGAKDDDFHEKTFDPEQFLGDGLNYGDLPHYEFFTRLYREGVNSSSVDYGFLCFYRVAEGIINLRRKWGIEQEGKSPEEVTGPSVVSEVVEGNEASEAFSGDLLGQSLWTAFKSLGDYRAKVGHAFLHSEEPLEGYADIISDRLEAEEQAGIRRAQARYIARRLMESMYFYSNESADSSEE